MIPVSPGTREGGVSHRLRQKPQKADTSNAAMRTRALPVGRRQHQCNVPKSTAATEIKTAQEEEGSLQRIPYSPYSLDMGADFVVILSPLALGLPGGWEQEAAIASWRATLTRTDECEPEWAPQSYSERFRASSVFCL